MMMKAAAPQLNALQDTRMEMIVRLTLHLPYGMKLNSVFSSIFEINLLVQPTIVF